MNVYYPDCVVLNILARSAIYHINQLGFPGDVASIRKVRYSIQMGLIDMMLCHGVGQFVEDFSFSWMKNKDLFRLPEFPQPVRLGCSLLVW